MIDSHIHLTNVQYKEDLNEVIITAKNNGVTQVMLIACGATEFDGVEKLAESDSGFFMKAYGIHPVDVSKASKTDLIELKEYLMRGAHALGEVGLDLHWHPSELELQKWYFEEQIKLSIELKLPLIIHARESVLECYDILKKYPAAFGVMHSYAGNVELANKFIELGFYIGISGPITFKNGISQKEVAKSVNLNYILVETDGPYLTPAPHRGKRNRPEYISHVIDEIAILRGTTSEVIKSATIKNTLSLFGGINV